MAEIELENKPKRGSMQPFYCPDCKITYPAMKYSPTRQRCPECSKKHTQEMNRKRGEEVAAQSQINKEVFGSKKHKTMAEYLSEEEREDMKRFKIQQEQCKTCTFSHRLGGNHCCNFLGLTGRRVSRGHKPGQCKDYSKKDKNTKLRDLAYQRKVMALAEADARAERLSKQEENKPFTARDSKLYW